MLLLLAVLLSQPAAATFDRAVAALAAGDLKTAEMGFQSVLKSSPKSVPALVNLGVVYSRMDRLEDAIQFYKRALDLSAHDTRLLLNLGLAHLKLDEHAAAKPLFDSVLRQQPSNAQARELLGTTQVFTDEPSEALDTLGPLAPSPSVSFLRMLAYLKLGRKEAAAASKEELFSHLGSADAQYLTGRAYYESTQFDDAADCFESAAATKPDFPGLARELGKTYISLGRESDAERQLRLALKQNVYDQEAAYFLGAFLLQRGGVEEGIRYLDLSRAMRPGFWGTYYYLGRARIQLQNFAAAIPLLEKAAKLNPNESAIQYQLGRALKALGREAESEAAFRRMRELRSHSADQDTGVRVLR